jgi:predicted SAM-dependent methyltransferase
MKRLVFGAGDRRIEGAVHHDVLPLPGIDIVCEFFDLPEEHYDRIDMTHVLEHFPTADTQKVLAKLRRMTDELYIEVPNFRWHAEILIMENRERDAVYYAFGGQNDIWDFHKTGFTPDILKEELTKAGFTIVTLSPGSSIECLCR